MSVGLKFFFDAFSQPCRAVSILLNSERIPHQPCLINLAKGESRSNEEFMKVSPGKTVPAIDDNGFKLFESAAIMKYLVDKYQLPDHWYPSDPQRRAKVEEYLNWHGTGLRMGAATVIFYKFLFPRMSGSEPDENKVQEGLKALNKGLKLLDTYFLKDTKFINSQEISIADIQAACEITQFWLADIDLLHDKPNLKNWLDNVQSESNPAFDEAHKMINLARAQGIFKGKL